MSLFNNFINKLFLNPEQINFRWRIIFQTCMLIVISCLTLKYANSDTSFFVSTFTKQLVWVCLGIIVLITVQWFRVQFLHEYAYHFYFLLLLMIISTYFMPVIGGSQRWVVIGSLSIQPSEVGKLLLVFTLARFIADFQGKIDDRKILLIGLILVFIPSVLIFQQPDFGTAIVYSFVALPMLYWGGVKPFYLFSVIAPFISIISAFHLTVFSIWMIFLVFTIFFYRPMVLHGSVNFILNISCGVLAPFIWENILFSHQRDRIQTLLSPMSDPQGAGYQVIQSITAIGSGGVWGKGLGLGTQTQLRFLPVRDTDFIISVIGEEMGLFGITIILCSFIMILYWITIYAGTISNRFSSLVLIGFVSILFIHLIVNMGMTVGLLPVTGLPAPFLSYGGSFLLTCFLIIALTNNIINQHI